MCCGQKRDALKSGQVADSADIKLFYCGQPAIQVRGNATGQLYHFSSQLPVQPVDRRDAVLLLQSRVFRQTK